MSLPHPALQNEEVSAASIIAGVREWTDTNETVIALGHLKTQRLLLYSIARRLYLGSSPARHQGA